MFCSNILSYKKKHQIALIKLAWLKRRSIKKYYFIKILIDNQSNSSVNDRETITREESIDDVSKSFEKLKKKKVKTTRI
jgi:hypothetical protein